jgi:hypothetical protein
MEKPGTQISRILHNFLSNKEKDSASGWQLFASCEKVSSKKIESLSKNMTKRWLLRRYDHHFKGIALGEMVFMMDKQEGKVSRCSSGEGLFVLQFFSMII